MTEIQHLASEPFASLVAGLEGDDSLSIWFETGLGDDGVGYRQAVIGNVTDEAKPLFAATIDLESLDDEKLGWHLSSLAKSLSGK